MRVRISNSHEFDTLMLRCIGGYYVLMLLSDGATIYKEKYLIGLFNKYHFIANMQDLGINQDIIDELLTFFK